MSLDQHVVDDTAELSREDVNGQTGEHVPLPSWVHEIRPHQLDAVREIVAAFREVDVVFLDAPTGSGKTLIAELVSRALGDPGVVNSAVDTLYVCSDKHLQDQFARDFTYARVLKGRSNYPTQRAQSGNGQTTAEDCTATGPNSRCFFCEGYRTCPYQIAKDDAASARLAVLNTAYFLTEANMGQRSLFGGSAARELVVVDEADTLEDMLMGYVEFTVPQWIGRELSLSWPVKGAHKSTLTKWLRSTAQAASRWLEDGHAADMKEKRRMQHFLADCIRVAGELDRDIEAEGDSSDDGTVEQAHGRWIRDYDTQTFTMKPVLVGPYGARRLWRHGRKFLLMSGSIISPDEMADSLGLPLEYTTVTVPMTFPVEHRPIIVAPVANIRRSSDDGDYANLAYAVDVISDMHHGERVLVHTVSFHLAQRLIKDCRLQGRTVCTYGNGRDKQQALDRYLSKANSILFAPSMDRGVDLPDEACRVVVVAKVPFPSLGDRRVSARMRLPGGQSWYTVQTVRKLVQMTGRGVRSEDDYAVSYVLDAQFANNVWGKSKRLFPGWWREAVQINGDVRWLMRGWDGRIDRPTADELWNR